MHDKMPSNTAGTTAAPAFNMVVILGIHLLATDIALAHASLRLRNDADGNVCATSRREMPAKDDVEEA